MKLYYSPGACSLAPHIMFREIGEPFELVEVNTARGENKAESYLRINPRGRVPAIDAAGGIFTETPAILTFLALRYPELRLVPDSGSLDQARCLEWLAWFSTSLHVAYLQKWRPERHLPDGAPSAELTGFASELIDRMNGEVEERLVGPWLVGEQYTVADIYALVFYGWGNRLGLAMSQACPKWAAWSGRMLARDSVRDSIAYEGIESWFPPSSQG